MYFTKGVRMILTQILSMLLGTMVSMGFAETTDGERETAVAGANYALTHVGASARCDNFINSRGELGTYGTALIEAIERVNPDCFYSTARFSRVLCPNFNSFGQTTKRRFIAFLFGSIAHYESSCNPRAQAQGVNDTADGLFQLEYSRNQRRNAGRDRVFCATDRGVNTQDITFQMECSASIFVDGYCERNSAVPGDTNWYWQKLNSPSGRITRMAQRFPGCF